ncbi:unnamed protein product [Blepharisma stoltei]|uniref:Pre-mRNA-splicing factor CWC24 n=1 Tax=Blepharisma stoltei TaxID=1481888 RepID=A0AAU9JBH6_9CILI|nr:unnamed protein product [Blepharisma stoltei]
MFQKREKRNKPIIDTTPEEEPVLIKKPKIEKHKTQENQQAKSEIMDELNFKDSTGIRQLTQDDATRELQLDLDKGEEGRSKAVKNLEISRLINSGELSTDYYRGQSSYPIYAEKSEGNIYASKFTGSLGPIRAPSNIRATCRFDYSYGICKDWKISGYCGYGDGCIFIHDRSNYKTGWELEKEWTEEQEKKRKKAYGENVSDEENYEISSEENKEEKCPICQEEYKDPVITQCSHKFCYKCAIEKYSENTKCFVCGKETKGIFNDEKADEKNNFSN